jgi:hypothetical protein
MKRILAFLAGFLILTSIVFAHEDHDHPVFEQAEAIINAEIPCNSLSEEQLEWIGDYFMEQMHPGEAHEVMDEMMGGEGSESLRQMHIALAKRLYCNDYSGMAQYGMMGMMGNGRGMMGDGSGGYGSGMMGTAYGLSYWNFINILYIILLIGLIFLVYFWIIKLWKNMKTKVGKK